MKKKVFLIGIVTVLALIFIFFISTPAKKLSSSQKEEAMTKILGRKPVLGNPNEPKGNAEFKGNYVTFSYPARAKIYVLKVNGEVKKDNWNLDSLNFDLEDPRSTFLLTVSEAPNGVVSLEDYPSVRLRQVQPGLYHGKEIVIDGHKGLEYDKNDSQIFEKTAFFFIKGKICTFSISGADVEGIEALFKQIMSTVKFLP